MQLITAKRWGNTLYFSANKSWIFRAIIWVPDRYCEWQRFRWSTMPREHTIGEENPEVYVKNQNIKQIYMFGEAFQKEELLSLFFLRTPWLLHDILVFSMLLFCPLFALLSLTAIAFIKIMTQNIWVNGHNGISNKKASTGGLLQLKAQTSIQ